MNYKIILYFFLVPNLIFSQSEKIISGQLICKDAILQGITILNLVTEKEAVSDFAGKFSIVAKPDDLLVIQSSNFEIVRESIGKDDYKKGMIFITLIKKIEQLEEVKIINYSNINAVSLGILSKPAKTYTTAERRMFAAKDESAVGQVINYFSGRTKMLKRYVAFEKIELRTAKLSAMFSDEYFIETLKIPENKVRAFQIYAAEDESVLVPLRQKNKFLVSYALTPLAKQYLDLQMNEPKNKAE